MPDGSFMCVHRIRANVDPDPRARAEIQFDARWLLDPAGWPPPRIESPDPILPNRTPLASVVLQWAEQDGGAGPTETIVAPTPLVRAATPTISLIYRYARHATPVSISLA